MGRLKPLVISNLSIQALNYIAPCLAGLLRRKGNVAIPSYQWSVQHCSSGSFQPMYSPHARWKTHQYSGMLSPSKTFQCSFRPALKAKQGDTALYYHYVAHSPADTLTQHLKGAFPCSTVQCRNWLHIYWAPKKNITQSDIYMATMQADQFLSPIFICFF